VRVMKIRFGDCTLDTDRRQLWRSGSTVHLSPKAFELLTLLVERRASAISKAEFHERLWPGTFVTDDSLSRLMVEVRGALGDDARRPRFVRTLHGFGYAFSADAVLLTDREATDPSTTSEGGEEKGGDIVRRATEPATAPRASRLRLFAGAASIAIVLVSTVIALSLIRQSTTGPGPVSFVVLPPEGTTLSPSASLLAVSPNGRHLAFLALSANGRRTLWVRPLESLAARELSGTDDAIGPFWSPDSRQLAFFADGKLKKVDFAGGPPEVIADAHGTSLGGAWNQQGSILFGGDGTGLFVVSASGGMPRAITRLDVAKGESAHSFPYFLPDGRYFTLLRRTGSWGSGGVYLGSLESAAIVPLLNADSQAIYTAPGYLVFLRDGVLYAQRFDPKLRRLAAEPRRIAEGVGSNPNGLRGMFSVSDGGVLAYRPLQETELIWFDRIGNPLRVLATASRDQDPALSPDVSRIAVDRFDPSTKTRNIWILELDRGVASRLTNGRWDIAPVWSPDGTRVAFTSDREGRLAIFDKPVAGASDERMLVEAPVASAVDWSRDGRFLFYTEPSFVRPNIAVLRLVTDREREQLIETPFSERTPRLSPDGRWLAYSSDETGRAEVYVSSFPRQQEKRRVSSSGGVEPVWRADGKELFYIAADQKTDGSISSSRRVVWNVRDACPVV
jgi:eukaryotic-like serine/threonine-protein kinase